MKQHPRVWGIWEGSIHSIPTTSARYRMAYFPKPTCYGARSSPSRGTAVMSAMHIYVAIGLTLLRNSPYDPMWTSSNLQRCFVEYLSVLTMTNPPVKGSVTWNPCYYFIIAKLVMMSKLFPLVSFNLNLMSIVQWIHKSGPLWMVHLWNNACLLCAGLFSAVHLNSRDVQQRVPISRWPGTLENTTMTSCDWLWGC